MIDATITRVIIMRSLRINFKRYKWN